MNNEFEVRIIDFGISRDSSLTITQNQNAFTLRYLSPEAITEAKDSLDEQRDFSVKTKKHCTQSDYEARDMYAFGLMFLECLSPPEDCERIPSLLKTFFLEDAGKYDSELWKILQISAPNEIELLQGLLQPISSKRTNSQDALSSGLFHLLSTHVDSRNCVVREENVENIREKLNNIRDEKKMMDNDSWEDRIRVEVDRGFEADGKRKDIVLDALRQSVRDANDVTDLLKRHSTRFIGEVAADAGGVTRELFYLLFQQVMSNYCDEIGRSEDGITYYLPTDTADHSDIFYLLGRLCFRCLLEKRSFCISFPPFFYSYILNQEPKGREDWVNYCSQCDPKFIPSVERSLYTPFVFEAMTRPPFEETFVSEEGLEFKLNEANKNEYLMYKIYCKLKGEVGKNRIPKNVDGFRRGFFSLMDESFSLEIRSILNPFEMVCVASGDRKLEVGVLNRNIQFEEVGMEKRKEHLIRYLSNCSEERRVDFVLFCTGSCDFFDGNLVKDGKPHAIYVRNHETNYYLKASTCFYNLHLGYKFEDEEYQKIEGRLDEALECFKKSEMDQ